MEMMYKFITSYERFVNDEKPVEKMLRSGKIPPLSGRDRGTQPSPRVRFSA